VASDQIDTFGKPGMDDSDLQIVGLLKALKAILIRWGFLGPDAMAENNWKY
jgi:hypothetical protein